MTEPSAEALLAHAGFLRALARSLLLDEGHAEDVVQETYLAAHDFGLRGRACPSASILLNSSG